DRALVGAGDCPLAPALAVDDGEEALSDDPEGCAPAEIENLLEADDMLVECDRGCDILIIENSHDPADGGQGPRGRFAVGRHSTVRHGGGSPIRRDRYWLRCA